MRFKQNFAIDQFTDKLNELSGAEIKAVCTEAGYFAIRDSRTTIDTKDLRQAIIKVKKEESAEGKDYLRMFG